MRKLVEELKKISKETRIPFKECAFLIKDSDIELDSLIVKIKKEIEEDFKTLRKGKSVIDKETKELYISTMKLAYNEELKKIEEARTIEEVLEVYRSPSCQEKVEQIAIIKIVKLYRKKNK
jgi:hypothetical protein